MNFNKRLIASITIISVVFFILIGFNVSPFLRGPGEWPPNWRWPYQFTNTLNKAWLPLLFIFLIIIIGYYFDKQKEIKFKNKLPLILIILVFITYFFQLSVIFFSRSGISVLVHRIINPNINGYFTEAIKIKNLGEFLTNYQKNVLSFSMHAKGHLPGSILLFWLIEKITYIIPFINKLTEYLSPKHYDVKLIWDNLTLNQKSGAILSTFSIPFLSSLNIIPIFFIAKIIYGYKTAIRSLLLTIFLPALTLFVPVSDVFFPIFFLYSFLFFIDGLKKENVILIFISGLIFSLGIFFSLRILPTLIIFTYYLLKNKIQVKKFLSFFILGLILPYSFLILIFKFNIVSLILTLLSGQYSGRHYLIWTIFNLYDFFVFVGLPITIVFLCIFLKKKADFLAISFTLMLLLLNFSGIVRAEVGRIWLPLMFPLIIIASKFLTKNLKISTKLFLWILVLQAIQILVIQEFWIMLY